MDAHFLRQHKVALAAGLAALAVVAVLAYPVFAPKPSTTVQQDAPAGAVAVASGTFQGAGDGIHHASGRVSILRDGEAYLLRFEGYQATDGPDVYFYLTRAPAARTTEEVESGLRVLVPGGAADGEATLRGDFHVPLPQGFDPATWQGVVAWCDQFNVLFGSAALA